MKINPLKQLYRDFIYILDGCVVKYKSIADENETIESKKAADALINATLQRDSFNTYYKYEPEVISEVLQIYDENQIAIYVNDRSKIPYEFRDRILDAQRNYIIKNYEESNNYYRALAGLPNYNSPKESYIYVDEETSKKLEVSSTIPIHQLDDNSVAVLEINGYLDEIIKSHPNDTYLKFIGRKRLDIVMCRTSNNFSLLKIPDKITEATWNSFSLIYDQCREYFVSCIYINEYRDIIEYYDNFIAMCIMIMTLQQVTMRIIKNVINRDFFDDYCVQLLFETYGLPYNTKMDKNIKTLILQNLNLLIQNKGTNKVIFDIASIFGYDRLKLFKYYLVKSRNFDKQGFPVTKYIEDPITHEKVLDYKEMYDVFFKKVALKDMDTYKAIMDPNNKVKYEEITKSDPFWIEDEKLYNEIYETEYNYVETKYMGVSISYRMTKILFENIYLLRMLFDNKKQLSTIFLDLPRISVDKEISLFDTIVLLCALTSKINKLKGNILFDESKIMHVIGFNFDQDFKIMREEILNNPNMDNDLVRFLEDIDNVTPDNINNLYKNFIELRSVLVDLMSETDNIDAYRAYKKMYDALYYADENKKIFNVGTADNPIYPKTFLEYLKYKNLYLYEFVMNTKDDDIRVYTNHIISKIMKIIPDLSYLGMYVDRSSTMEMMLLDLIKFFKSYTTDMLGLDVVYILDLKPENMLKLIDYVVIHSNLTIKDCEFLSYVDNLEPSVSISHNEMITFIDRIGKILNIINMNDVLSIDDEVMKMNINLLCKEFINIYSDIIKLISINLITKDKKILTDKFHIYSNINIDDLNGFKDNILFIKIFEIIKEYGVNLYDAISSENKNIITRNKFSFIDHYDVINKFSVKDYIFMKSNIEALLMTIFVRELQLKINDIIKLISSNINIKDFNKIIKKENVDVTSKPYVNDIINMRESISYNKPFNYEITSNSVELYDATSNINKDIEKSSRYKFKDSIYKIFWT